MFKFIITALLSLFVTIAPASAATYLGKSGAFSMYRLDANSCAMAIMAQDGTMLTISYNNIAPKLYINVDNPKWSFIPVAHPVIVVIDKVHYNWVGDGFKSSTTSGMFIPTTDMRILNILKSSKYIAIYYNGIRLVAANNGPDFPVALQEIVKCSYNYNAW